MTMDLGQDPGDLDDIVHQAEQMIADIQGESELPRITRSLEQMRQEGERMFSRGSQNDVKAARLLGSRVGFELPSSLAHKLETVNVLRSYEALEFAPDTDIQTFLKNERENVLLAAIEQTRRNTFEESESRSERAVEQWWDLEKQRILRTLVGSGGQGPDLPEMRAANQSVLLSAGDTQPGPNRTTLTRTELYYAKQIDKYLLDQVSGNNPEQDLCSTLNATFLEGDDSVLHSSSFEDPIPEAVHGDDIVKFWRLISRLTDLPRAANQGTRAGDVMAARCTTQLMQAGVRAAIGQLEAELVFLMRAAVEANPREARRGGRPGTGPLVKAFITIRLAAAKNMLHALEDGMVEGKPVWPMIYLCMRSGDLPEALEMAKAAGNNLGEFPGLLEEYIRNDRTLPADLQAKMRMNYKRSVKNGTDPYKRLVYCVVGCCDPSDNHSEVATSIDDFLWIKLHQLSWLDPRPNLNTSAVGAGMDDTLTLPQLQKQLYEEYGETHFEAWKQPLLFFKVLFFTQQFEAALGFLSRFDALRCHAVHAALVLRDRHLLLLPSNVQAQLVSRQADDPASMRRLNLARMIMIYTRKFETTDPREALNYFFFLKDIRIGSENAFYSCVSELALETREFELILGRIDENGHVLPGAVERFGQPTQPLTSHVAKELEKRGHLEESARLHELAGDLDRSVGLISQLLSAQLTQSPASMDRVRIVDRAVKLGTRLRQQSPRAAGTTAGKTLYTLLDLCAFFKHLHQSDFDSALSVMQGLRLLPTGDDLDARTRNFAQLPEEIRRAMPQILIATMRCLKAKMTNNRKSSRPLSDMSSSSPVIDDIRTQARSLISFAGRLPYRMPGDVYAKLSQMEMEML